MKKLVGTLLISLFGFASTNSFSENQVEGLSPELRALLTQEMLAIEEGMKNIVPAFAAGDLEQVAEIAGKISNSYILKQQITDEQKQELRSKLPKEFIAKDQEFHKDAGMLEHVSKEAHTELVAFYYSRLLESCSACHSQHASHRFPNFSDQSPAKDHHH